MRDFDKELVDYNQTDAPAAVRFGEVSASPAVAQGSANTTLQSAGNAPPAGTPTGDQAMAEKMLKYWYQQADDETRQRFWEWITE